MIGALALLMASVAPDADALVGASLVSDAPVGRGLVFVKTKKCGGTTAAGVFRRIGAAHNVSFFSPAAKRAKESDARAFVEGSRSALGPATPLGWAEEAPYRPWLSELFPGSFRATVVRRPIERSFAAFYHFAMNHGKANTTEVKRRWISDEASAMFEYLGGLRQAEGSRAEEGASAASILEVLGRYDLLMLVERFAESVVVLQMSLPGVRLCDVLYLPAKVSHFSTRRRVHVPLGWEEPQLVADIRLAFAAGKDEALYAAASIRLDEAISRLRPAGFDNQLRLFSQMLAAVQPACSDPMQRQALIFQAYGKRQPFRDRCYFRDTGCNYHCLDAWAYRHRACQTGVVFRHGGGYAVGRCAFLDKDARCGG